ncbi:sirohydrochlorin cobaltochelatase [Clostridium sp. AM58-1XD]|uniref:sirohydrochlorin cobaltochelatase n=1 Tax=Clostridium sp. AM58-1XD TaxID=2292307 RepID=UPI000E4FE71E|nr:sirohydrochlorin cobaltochelatase [Clostridium sp. AM58-1XD]RGY99040.1 sirohydrochlorin cobaltochelatase [Clostridium sp. AM58-1XD]
MENVKKGILVVSFGTSHGDTRVKTIEAIEKDIENVYTDRSIYRAWTSNILINKLKCRDGYHVDTVKEALERMKKDGITHVVVQPTHVINGMENDRMKDDVLPYMETFASVAFGTPLLTGKQDCADVRKVLTEEFREIPEDTAVIFLGHGTAHKANAVYAALDRQLKDMGRTNFYMRTIEADTPFEPLQMEILEKGYRRVILAPFMIVAGEHAKHDMVGRKDSWKSRLEEIGCRVECVFKGLGEYEGIRRIFLDHIKEAETVCEGYEV